MDTLPLLAVRSPSHFDTVAKTAANCGIALVSVVGVVGAIALLTAYKPPAAVRRAFLAALAKTDASDDLLLRCAASDDVLALAQAILADDKEAAETKTAVRAAYAAAV